MHASLGLIRLKEDILLKCLFRLWKKKLYSLNVKANKMKLKKMLTKSAARKWMKPWLTVYKYWIVNKATTSNKIFNHIRSSAYSHIFHLFIACPMQNLGMALIDIQERHLIRIEIVELYTHTLVQINATCWFTSYRSIYLLWIGGFLFHSSIHWKNANSTVNWNGKKKYTQLSRWAVKLFKILNTKLNCKYIKPLV